MHAITGILHKIGVAEQRCPLALRIALLHQFQTALCLQCPTLSRIQQEEMIESLVVAAVVLESVGQSCQELFALA